MIISLYAHGMSVRDILHHLEQVYGTQLSHETVSRITDQVLEEVRAWQSRPLDPVYAVVFLDAIMVKVRDNHVVQNKPAYLAVGIDADGEKHVLGIWLAKTAAGHRHRRGGRPVLELGHDRPAQPGRAGHPDRLLRRAGRLRGRHHRRVPRHRGAALRGPPHQQRPAAGGPPRRRGGRQGAARDLHRPGRRGRLRRPGRVRRLAVGPQVPPGRPGLGGRLGRVHPVPGLQPGRPQAALHHQRDRVAELPAAQGHQGPRPLPDRRRRGQAAVAGHHQHRGQARPRARRPGAGQTGKRSTSPPGSSRGSGSWAGARPSTSSTAPTRAV